LRRLFKLVSRRPYVARQFTFLERGAS
jgi:hypothetical protein